MSSVFEIAGASIAGRAHVEAGRNNQDAFAWSRNEKGIAAVVCDGCGSGLCSEVGARIGARMFAELLSRSLGENRAPSRDTIEGVKHEVLNQLDALARRMAAENDASSRAKIVTDYFLFTVVGAVIGEASAFTFSIGDGAIAINGDKHLIGPFPENEPPYLGYALLGDAPSARSEILTGRSIPIGEVRSVVLATDGFEGFEIASGAPIEVLAEDERLFRNPDILRRRFVVAGRGPKGAAMSDDVTMIVVRRTPEEP